MSDIWEIAWDIIDDALRQMTVSLASSYPEMSWSSGHSDNRSFPFRAYAAFNRGCGESEDIVVSADFRISGDKLRYSADVGLDDGKILADGSTGIINVASGLIEARSDVETATREITRFLAASEPVLRDALG